MNYLMASPKGFCVKYAINPWMNPENQVDPDKALDQWCALYQAIRKHHPIFVMSHQDHNPDSVFAANAGFVINERAVISRFCHPERQTEQEPNHDWFTHHGFKIDKPQNPSMTYEGGGDTIYDFSFKHLWVGHGFRTDQSVGSELNRYFHIKAIMLHLVDPHFYHLDTCFCPLKNKQLLLYREAFDEPSLATIDQIYPPKQQIQIDRDDAMAMACNAVALQDQLLIQNPCSNTLTKQLIQAGYDVMPLPFSEFIKSGGSARCLVLPLHTISHHSF
ncbi:arginine deiminase-related protein [Gammaproteobacteria bacterium]|nr:arginine deiminase-related protein [Gammaproteobacteria bacterium]